MYAVHVSLLFFSYVSYFQIPLELKRIQYLHLDLFSVQLFFLPSSILRQFSFVFQRCQIACSASAFSLEQVRSSRAAMLSLINHSQPPALVGGKAINCEIFARCRRRCSRCFCPINFLQRFKFLSSLDAASFLAYLTLNKHTIPGLVQSPNTMYYFLD